MKSPVPEPALKIIHIDNHLLVVDKPAGMPSQPDDSGDPSLADLGKEYLRREFAKPGNVYLGLVHRLDRPTSGLVILARTDKAASRMAEQFRRREVEKRYLALVECRTAPGPGKELRNQLAPAANGGMRVAAGERDGAREARLSYRTLKMARDGRTALLEVNLETGVKHQIRCQLAHTGLPVIGDFRYGAFGEPARPRPVLDGRAVLLHAWRIGFMHPVRKERLELTAELPAFWDGFMKDFPE